MLAIVNVSADNVALDAANDYEVRVNQEVIATFKHKRSFGGAARCLRDAADAVDKCRKEQSEKFWLAILEREAGCG